jgi:hypothetical protein
MQRERERERERERLSCSAAHYRGPPESDSGRPRCKLETGFLTA